MWWHRFVSGGIGDCTAVLFSHPLDLLKVRQQLRGEGVKTTSFQRGALLELGKSILRSEGLKGLYRGLSASFCRQGLYSTLRHGLYGVYAETCDTSNMALNIVAGCVCGALSAFVANPTDVILIRMQADRHYEKANRRNYKHFFDGIRQVLKAGPAKNLWVGASPTVIRAMAVTSSQLCTYWKMMEILEPYNVSGMSKNLTSALCSAVVAVLLTNPVDVIKTRIMNMYASSSNYASPLSCFMFTLKHEGFLGLYKGLAATTLRLGPHTMILWIVQDFVGQQMKSQ